MSDFEDLVRTRLRAEAAAIDGADAVVARASGRGSGSSRSRVIRHLVPLLAGVFVMALALAVALVVTGRSGSDADQVATTQTYTAAQLEQAGDRLVMASNRHEVPLLSVVERASGGDGLVVSVPAVTRSTHRDEELRAAYARAAGVPVVKIRSAELPTPVSG